MLKRFPHKKNRSLVSPRLRYPVWIAAALIIALIVALVIVSVVGAGRAQVISRNREQIARRTQDELNRMLLVYDQISLPTADLQGTIVPGMRTYLYAARVLNAQLTESYGAAYALLDDDLLDRFVTALDGVDRALQAGQSTDEAVGVLSECVTELESGMSSRFGLDGSLLPQTTA